MCQKQNRGKWAETAAPGLVLGGVFLDGSSLLHPLRMLRKSLSCCHRRSWHFASWLQSLLRCPGWALPVTPCLPGCPGVLAGSGVPLFPSTDPRRRGQGRQPSASSADPAKEPRKERADHRQGSSSADRSQALSLWPIKAL